MILGVDPKVDYAFKHVFGRDKTRPILIDILEQVLNPAPGHHIEDLELLNPFNPKESFDGKSSVLDIKVRDQSGRLLNVEMQIFAPLWYPKRIVYYGTKLHQQQLHEGENYNQLRPTISISFLNNVLYPQVSGHHLRFRLRDELNRVVLSDDIEFHILELPKFTKSLAELRGGLDIWLYFLRHAEKIDTDAVPVEMQQPMVLRAMEELKMLTQTDIERERYEARRKAQLDHNTWIQEARQEGRTEGLCEGQISIIRLCEGLLKRPATPAEQLNSLSIEQLTHLADELQQQVQQQR